MFLNINFLLGYKYIIAIKKCLIKSDQKNSYSRYFQWTLKFFHNLFFICFIYFSFYIFLFFFFFSFVCICFCVHVSLPSLSISRLSLTWIKRKNITILEV